MEETKFDPYNTTLCEYVSIDDVDDLYELISKVNEFERKTENEEQKKLAQEYKKMLDLANVVYTKSYDVLRTIPDFEGWLYNVRHHEWIRNNILSYFIEEKGEECLEDEDCFRDEVSNSDYFNSFEVFDDVFVNCNEKSFEEFPIEERIEMLYKYFREFL